MDTIIEEYINIGFVSTNLNDLKFAIKQANKNKETKETK